MKTVLLATDFSDNAKDAARYGFNLARRIRAKVIIVNAMIVAAEIPQSGFASWSDDAFDGLLQDYTDELERFKTELESSVPAGEFCPPMVCVNEIGRFTDVVNSAAKSLHAELVVIGTHRGGLLNSLLIGNHAEQLIDAATSPLLIVKPGTAYKPVKKIAFATDFSHPEKDLAVIYALIPMAKLLNAEILLAHVTNNQQEEQAQFRKTLAEYLVEISNRADYPNIYYRLIHNAKTENGLTELCEHGQVDILAMAHRSRNLLAEYFGHSHTKNMNKLSSLPLLVFPATNN